MAADLWYAYGLEAMEDFLSYDEENTDSDDVKIMEQILISMQLKHIMDRKDYQEKIILSIL